MSGDRLPPALMALRAANELRDGEIVNLGYGLPGLVSDCLLDRPAVWLQSENGVLGLGQLAGPEEDAEPELVNANSQVCHLRPGGSVSDMALSFALIRGGRLDVAVLGALQVSERGDLANWAVPARGPGGIGGAMDLAGGARRLIVLMHHVTREGAPRILARCTYPLTAARCVDTIITDIAVIDVTPEGLQLREVAPGWTAAAVQRETAARLSWRGEPPEMTL